MSSKSASAWSSDASALMATTAIRQSTNRRMESGATARAIQGGGLLVVGQSANRDHLASEHEPSQHPQVAVISGARQHLHDDRFGRG